jgi:phospholipid/cholesterol/gamma-HCH transport system substrate-binding protein
VLSAGARVVQDPSKGARFGLDLDQFPVCTKGYTPAAQQVVPDGSAAQQNKALPLNLTCTEAINSATDVRGSRNAPRPAGDTTDPALGGYAYGQAGYEGSSDGKVVDGAAFDPSSGLVSGPNGQQYLMGADGGQQAVLGSNSWKYLLLAPLTS